MKDRKRIYIICLVVLLSSFSLFFSHLFYVDDSYITLRYAQRLADGKGLTWNDGERVEGFTSFLWMIQNAFLRYIGVNPVSGSRYLGLAYYLAILVVLILSKVPSLWLIPLMTLPSLNIFAMSGMETVSFCFWMLAGTIFVTKEIERKKNTIQAQSPTYITNNGNVFAISGILFAAGGLTHPEGILAGLLVLMYLILSKMISGAIRFSIGFIPPVLGYQLFRMLYFRDILPNTYYAKSAHISKLILLKSWVSFGAKWSFEWIPIAILIFLILRRESIKKYMIPLLVALPVFLTYFVGGGDHFKGIRMILPGILVIAYAAGQSFKGRMISLRKSVFAVGVLVSLYQLFLSTILWQTPIFPLTFGLKPVERGACHGEIVGSFLEKNLPPGTLVAVNTAGATPYFASSLNFIDMLGLSDRIIAQREIHEMTTIYQRYPGHFKGNGAYVLSKEPDLIIIGPNNNGILKDDNGYLFLSDYEILKDKRFKKSYSPYQLEIPLTNQQREGWKWYEIRKELKEGHYFVIFWLRNESRKVDKLKNIGVKLRSEEGAQ